MALTVRELIEQLSDCDPDLPVVMSSDAEGNRYSPMSELGLSYYEPTNSWSGYTYATPEFIFSEEGKRQGFSEEDLPPESAVLVVTLWPVN